MSVIQRHDSIAIECKRRMLIRSGYVNFCKRIVSTDRPHSTRISHEGSAIRGERAKQIDRPPLHRSYGANGDDESFSGALIVGPLDGTSASLPHAVIKAITATVMTPSATAMANPFHPPKFPRGEFDFIRGVLHSLNQYKA